MLPDLPLDVDHRYNAVSRLAVGISVELQHYRTKATTRGIAQEHKALVVDSHTHRVGQRRGNHHVLGHSDKAHSDRKLFVIRLVERLHQPEDA